MGNMNRQPLGEVDQLLKPRDVASRLQRAAMDRTPAFRFGGEFYCEGSRLDRERIMSTQELYAERPMLKCVMADALHDIHFWIAVGNAVARDDGIYETHRDADATGFDPLNEGFGLSRHIKCTRNAGTRQHSMALGAPKWVGEVHMGIDQSGDDETTGRVDDSVA